MGDLISRQAAIELIHSLYPSAPIMPMNRKWWKKKYKPYIEAEKVLEMLPSVQPERKKGKWTKYNACEFCGFKPWYERDIHTLSFCPNCGADMRGEHEQTN